MTEAGQIAAQGALPSEDEIWGGEAFRVIDRMREALVQWQRQVFHLPH